MITHTMHTVFLNYAIDKIACTWRGGSGITIQFLGLRHYTDLHAFSNHIYYYVHVYNRIMNIYDETYSRGVYKCIYLLLSYNYMGSRTAYIHRACSENFAIYLHMIQIGQVQASQCGGVVRAGTTIYDGSLRGELGWVVYIIIVYAVYIGILLYTYIYDEPTKVFDSYLDKPTPSSSFGPGRTTPLSPLVGIYRLSREKWISSSKHRRWRLIFDRMAY